jgi:hypothetical protein
MSRAVAGGAGRGLPDTGLDLNLGASGRPGAMYEYPGGSRAARRLVVKLSEVHYWDARLTWSGGGRGSGGVAEVVLFVSRWAGRDSLRPNVDHDTYVVAGQTAVLVHNCGNGPSDDLLDYADQNIGKTNVASEVTASNGATGYGVSTARASEELTPQVRKAVEATGHHGGCAEIGALCDLKSQGAPLAGSDLFAVKVAGGSQGYDYDEHGDPLEPCSACQSLFNFLNGESNG